MRINSLQASDLAVVIPTSRAELRALEMIPERWLDQVDEALINSELGERISDESWPEDWRLVSLRISPCSPLGRVADPEEIDRLCWPGVRLVFQPIVERVMTFGVIRDYYADDRAIHALYRSSPRSPELHAMREALAGGARLNTIEVSQLTRFEASRDEAARALLKHALALRVGSGEGERDQISERVEFNQRETEQIFWERLIAEVLTPHCQPESLHELTAFSLPLGRNPASADLWSFVAFHGEGGLLTQAHLEVLDPESGAVLFSLSEAGLGGLSEDVTTAHGDPMFDQALSSLPPEQRDRLARQIISDTAQLTTHGARINDPYQTLVSHTTCASCHRSNELDFNFHNLSYFEDHPLTVSPRTIADVERDLAWSAALLSP